MSNKAHFYKVMCGSEQKGTTVLCEKHAKEYPSDNFTTHLEMVGRVESNCEECDPEAFGKRWEEENAAIDFEAFGSFPKPNNRQG